MGKKSIMSRSVSILFPVFLSLIFISGVACKSAGNIPADDEMLDQERDPSGYFSAWKDDSHTAAVLTFASAGGSIASFDAFVTDEVIRRLSGAKNLKLIERSRLDLVLKEQSLSQSGLLSVKESVMIGNFLPVQSLVMGTYTYRGEAFHVKGRIVDSKTGEVKNTFRFKINYAVAKPAADHAGVKTEEGCDSVQKPVYFALRDLTTPPAVESAVKEAVKVPFYKKPCGRVHMSVMSEFEKGKLYPAEYHRFLYKTLEGMERPKEEYYAIKDIFSYFASDGVMSEEEWAASREILKKAWHPFHMKYFFNTGRYPMKVLERRSTELLQLARKREIGRPYALSEYRIADDMLSMAFMRNDEPGIEFSLYVVSSLKDPEKIPDKQFKEFLGVLESCYKNSMDRELQKKSLDLMISFYKLKTPDSELGYDLWYYLNGIDEKIHDTKKKNPNLREPVYNPEDLRRLGRELGEWFCLLHPKMNDSYYQKDFLIFMKRYGVVCR